ncbi:MAG TPA: BadF/BadG/BcrA/BcrD ATPase family protein [Vicinamibacterales bacterium]
MHVLGIDAGGSKTVALVTDANGAVIGEGRAGGANLQTEGELQVEKVLHEVIERAMNGRYTPPEAVCLGMAGVDRESDGRLIRDIMRRLGFRQNTLIVNDALIALVAGAGANPGVVVISGTGSIAFGVSHRGLAARAGGWGPTLGDEGSGYWIGRRALEAVVRDVDGRGPKTALTERVLEFFSLSRPELLVSEIYHQPHGRRAIASLAPEVDRARLEGDLVAGEIMTDAANELATAAGSVITRLDMRGEQFPILLAGGMLKQSEWLAAEVLRRMAEVAPRSEVLPLTEEPVIGAVRLATAAATGRVRVPPYIDSFRATPQP